MTYEEAINKLETLARQMEQGSVPVDEMADRLREAQNLIKYCRERLVKADETVKEILDSKQ